MSIDARLTKLMPVLSAKERAILVLRCYKDGTAEDPEWRRSMPDWQLKEFNRLVALMNASNKQLLVSILLLGQLAERLYQKLFRLMTLVEFGSCIAGLATLIPASRRTQAEAIAGDGILGIPLPWREDRASNSWIDLAESMDAHLREDVVGLWQELGAINALLDEVARDFDGEDPLRPWLRGQLTEVRERIRSLHAALNTAALLELPEPDADAHDHVRGYFDKGVEVYQRL